MNVDDFIHESNDARWLYHKTLPLVVYRPKKISKLYWYLQKIGYSHMNELIGREIEDVTDEEISLYILKYSNL
jgi:hypothetical protein